MEHNRLHRPVPRPRRPPVQRGCLLRLLHWTQPPQAAWRLSRAAGSLRQRDQEFVPCTAVCEQAGVVDEEHRLGPDVSAGPLSRSARRAGDAAGVGAHARLELAGPGKDGVGPWTFVQSVPSSSASARKRARNSTLRSTDSAPNSSANSTPAVTSPGPSTPPRTESRPNVATSRLTNGRHALIVVEQAGRIEVYADRPDTFPVHPTSPSTPPIRPPS